MKFLLWKPCGIQKIYMSICPSCCLPSFWFIFLWLFLKADSWRTNVKLRSHGQYQSYDTRFGYSYFYQMTLLVACYWNVFLIYSCSHREPKHLPGVKKYSVLLGPFVKVFSVNLTETIFWKVEGFQKVWWSYVQNNAVNLIQFTKTVFEIWHWLYTI